jgi:hypothetical protein
MALTADNPVGTRTMHIDGQCHCGEIQYEAEINPDNVILCHCSDCQAMSGAPYRVNVPVLIERLTLRGEPARYIKIGSSGAEVTTTFCRTCGSPIYSCKGKRPAFAFLRLGGARQRAELPPKNQGFCDTALPWAWNISDVRVIPQPTQPSS